MIKRRKPLGSPLPRVKSVDKPTDEQLTEYHHRFDALVPEWAGLLDPDGKRFSRDDVSGVITRVRDGHIVTRGDVRMAMALLTERLRGK